MIKDLSANAGNAVSIPGSGRSPGVGNGNPLQYSSEKAGGYSPEGQKESDVAERLSTAQQHILYSTGNHW